MERLDDASKNWKFSSADIKERQFWEDYMNAYADNVLTETSTELAPWYVIPADNKWFMRYAVGRIICDRMQQLIYITPNCRKRDWKSWKSVRKKCIKH